MGSPLDSLLGAYSRLPVPSHEEQLLLSRAIRKWLDFDPTPDDAPPGVRRAGIRAREQMISRNMLLVAKQAQSFSVSSVNALEVQDLIQEGVLGLARAAEKFDPTRGNTFATYAMPWIRYYMTNLIHSSGPIRIPVKRSQCMNKLRQWVEAFRVREGRLPTDEEAIEGMEITAADLRILRQAAAVRRVTSLDSLMGDDDSDTFMSLVVAPASPASNTKQQVVLDALKPWPELAEILERRLAGQSYQEAGMAMGLSRVAAERLSSRALAMAQRLVAAEQQDDQGGQVLQQLRLEVEVQLQLFPLVA